MGQLEPESPIPQPKGRINASNGKAAEMYTSKVQDGGGWRGEGEHRTRRRPKTAGKAYDDDGRGERLLVWVLLRNKTSHRTMHASPTSRRRCADIWDLRFFLSLSLSLTLFVYAADVGGFTGWPADAHREKGVYFFFLCVAPASGLLRWMDGSPARLCPNAPACSLRRWIKR